MTLQAEACERSRLQPQVDTQGDHERHMAKELPHIGRQAHVVHTLDGCDKHVEAEDNLELVLQRKCVIDPVEKPLTFLGEALDPDAAKAGSDEGDGGEEGDPDPDRGAKGALGAGLAMGWSVARPWDVVVDAT